MSRSIGAFGTLALVATAAMAIASSTAHAVDWVRADVGCAPSVNVKLDWQNHFGSDPRFTVHRTSAHNLTPKFESISRIGQVIWCRYKLSDVVRGSYTYRVQRQIHPTEGCKQINPTTLSCLVRDK